MATQLNIRIDKVLADEAKEYAEQHGKSLSDLIEEYLKLLVSKKRKDFEPGPRVKSLWGSVKPAPGKGDYNDLIEEGILKKHLK